MHGHVVESQLYAHVCQQTMLLLCSPLDVHSETWAHLPGFQEEMEHRRAKLAALKVLLLPVTCAQC